MLPRRASAGASLRRRVPVVRRHPPALPGGMLWQDSLLHGVVPVLRKALHRHVVPACLHRRDARFAVGDAPDPLPRERVERLGEGRLGPAGSPLPRRFGRFPPSRPLCGAPRAAQAPAARRAGRRRFPRFSPLIRLAPSPGSPYTQSVAPLRTAASDTSIPISSRMPRKSASSRAARLAMSTLFLMSATHEYPPFSRSSFSALRKCTLSPGRPLLAGNLDGEPASRPSEKKLRPRSSASRWIDRMSSFGTGSCRRDPVSRLVLFTTTWACMTPFSLSSW